MRPFEQLLQDALKDFEACLSREPVPAAERACRLEGAREFAMLLLSQPLARPAGGAGHGT